MLPLPFSDEGKDLLAAPASPLSPSANILNKNISSIIADIGLGL
jgi:hypothetical protein